MTTATLKTIAIVATMCLLGAGLAWAEEPAVASAVAAAEEGCGATVAVDTTDAEALAAWAYDRGFERIFTRADDTSAMTIACPAVVDCNATHCVETTTCSVTDTGSVGCCFPSGACVGCINGTIKVKRCRCQGGGCVNNPSQSFFCG